MATRFLLLATIATLTLAGPADAAQLKRLVWVKTQTAWKARAKAHGATATCDAWSATAAVLGCEFKSGSKRWQATLQPEPQVCVYQVSFSERRGVIGTNLLGQTLVKTCGVRSWWLKLPDLWTLRK